MASTKRTLSDLRVFGRGYLRNRIGLFFGLIFPVILIVLFGAIFSGNSYGTILVYAQNQDGGPLSAQFLSALNSTGVLNVQSVSASDNLTKFLADHSTPDGIIIPANFTLDYAMLKSVNITVYGNPSQSTSGIVSGTVNGVANYFNLNRFNGTAVIGLLQATVNTQQTKYVDFLIPGLIGFSILVNPMFSLVSISSEYKKSKLFKQLSLTPLTKMEWLASKVIWYIFLSTVSFLLMTAVGVFVWGAHITLTVWLVPFLLLGPTLFASMGMLVGTLTKNPDTASVIGNVISFPMMFLSGTFFPLYLYPEYLRTFAHVLPLFYINEGLNAVMVYANYAQALIDLAVIAVITVVLFVAAAKLFKWRED
jgi:ABC-2 type transport system permease protein